MTDRDRDIVVELVGPLGLQLLEKVCDPAKAIEELQAGTLPENLKKSILILSKIHELAKAGGHGGRDKKLNLPGQNAQPLKPVEPVPNTVVQPASIGRKTNALDTTPNPPAPTPNTQFTGKQSAVATPKLPGIKPPKLPGVKPAKPVGKSEFFLAKSQLQYSCKKCGSAQIDASGYVGCPCQPLTKAVQSTPMPMGLKLNVDLPKDQLKALLSQIRR